MFLDLIVLLTALAISTVSAWYSIIGLTSIFAAASAWWSIVIMGSVLEVGKVVSTIWLRKNWRTKSKWVRNYLIVAVFGLMFVTSMGIFGFLSKAHIDQNAPTGDKTAQVSLIEEKIKTEQETIASSRAGLKQLDAAVNETIARTTDDKGTERAITIRRQQAKERSTLSKEIDTAQKKITALQEQKAPLASEVRKMEAEVGPIKYIAALIYGDHPDQSILEAAVRWVIILIVVVFDPLALALILAANTSMAERKEELQPKKLTLEEEEEPLQGLQRPIPPPSTLRREKDAPPKPPAIETARPKKKLAKNQKSLIASSKELLKSRWTELSKKLSKSPSTESLKKTLKSQSKKS